MAAQYLDMAGLTTYHNKIKPTLEKATSAYTDTQAFKNGDKPLASPTISENSWVVKNNTNTNVVFGTYEGTSITVPTGAKVTYTGRWKWVHDDSYKDPESVSSQQWGTTLLANNTESSAFTSDVITANFAQNITAASVTLSAKRKGLMVNNQKITEAKGNDTTAASAVVKFMDNLYWGNVTTDEPDAATIAGLDDTILTTTKVHTVTATTNPSQYFCYAYPKIYGELTSIVADGADPIKDNFKAPIIAQVVNKAGFKKEYYVYVSVNRGAFNNNSLAFK